MSIDYGAKVSRIQIDGFGKLPGDTSEIVRRYTITNKNDAIVRLISLGAGIQSIVIPNKNYDMADVILGFDTVDGYLKNRYIGRIVGRVSDSQTKNFPNNENKNNEIYKNFDIVNWNSYILGNQVVMTYVSRDLDNGYPGDLLIQVKYTWTDDNKLHINISARSTKSTPINISSHCYFNLAGHSMGSEELNNHVITVNADKWIQQDFEKCNKPISIIDKVEKTPFDLRFPVQMSIEKQFQVPGGGYDHNLCINNPDGPWCYRFHARAMHLESNRTLEVYSNHPTMKLYTGNYFPCSNKIYSPNLYENKEISTLKSGNLNEEIIGKNGMLYTRHCCFAVIPQNYYEESDFEKFPHNILHPGQIYVHDITYDFGTELNYNGSCADLKI